MDVRTSYIEKLEKKKPNGKCRKWRLWVRLSDGKKRSRRFQGAYREAQAALSTFRAEVESEVKSTGTFAGCAESWLAYRESMGDVRFSTLRRNRNAITALSREFGDVPLADMTPERCRDGLAAIRNGNNATGRVLGGAYMAKLYSVLHRVLLMALHDGKIARDPLANVPAPKVDTREKDWLPPDELASTVRALEALPMDGKVICYLLMCYLGLRRGECVALLVEDVDLDARIVHVRHGIEERDMSVSDTKTRAGVRDLPMPETLVDDLRKWLAIRAGRARADCPTLAINARGTALGGPGEVVERPPRCPGSGRHDHAPAPPFQPLHDGQAHERFRLAAMGWVVVDSAREGVRPRRPGEPGCGVRIRLSAPFRHQLARFPRSDAMACLPCRVPRVFHIVPQ